MSIKKSKTIFWFQSHRIGSHKIFLFNPKNITLWCLVAIEKSKTILWFQSHRIGSHEIIFLFQTLLIWCLVSIHQSKLSNDFSHIESDLIKFFFIPKNISKFNLRNFWFQSHRIGPQQVEPGREHHHAHPPDHQSGQQLLHVVVICTLWPSHFFRYGVVLYNLQIF